MRIEKGITAKDSFTEDMHAKRTKVGGGRGAYNMARMVPCAMVGAAMVANVVYHSVNIPTGQENT
jgi:hypothetical protein